MGTSLPRTLHPVLNAPGFMAAAGAIYAAAAMIWNAYNHHGVWNISVLIAAIGAVSALLTRQVVTPVADPKDGNGDPLVTAPAAPAAAASPPGSPVPG